MRVWGPCSQVPATCCRRLAPWRLQAVTKKHNTINVSTVLMTKFGMLTGQGWAKAAAVSSLQTFCNRHGVGACDTRPAFAQKLRRGRHVARDMKIKNGDVRCPRFSVSGSFDTNHRHSREFLKFRTH